MELFTYLMAKNDHNTSVKKDLFSYLLGKNQSGTYTDYSGTSLSINNTKKAKMKVNLLGNTSQTGTPTPDNPIPVNVVSGDNEVVVRGKNITNVDTYKGGFVASNGVLYENVGISNYTNQNGEITFTTTETYKGTFSDYIDIEANTKYKLSYVALTSGVSYFGFYNWYDKDKTFISRRDISASIANSPSNAKYLVIFLGITATGTASLKEVQVELGDTATSYEPYQSSTYPIHLGTYELCKIGTYQDKFIRNSGKNLVNSVEYNKYVSGSGNVTSGNTDYLGINDFVSCKPNTTYTISFEHDNSSGQLYVAYRDIDNNFISRENYSTNRTFTTPNNAYYLFVYVYKSSTFTTIGGYVMLNEGSTALPYEPYGDGDWYKEGKIGKVVLDGSEDEDWVSAGSYQRYTITMSDFTSPSSSSIANILCDKLIATSKNNVAFVDNAISGGDENNHKMFVRIDNTITTVALLRTFLSNNPLLVYYQLSTPTYTKIEGTLKDELEAVWRAYSYKGQTNISQINNDLPFELNVSVKVGS